MNVIDNSLCEYEASFQLTSNLKDDIIRQSDLSSPSDANNKALKDLKYKKNAVNKIALEELREQMTPHQLKANDIARCDGASIWLTTLPLKEENYVLNKQEFFSFIPDYQSVCPNVIFLCNFFSRRSWAHF